MRTSTTTLPVAFVLLALATGVASAGPLTFGITGFGGASIPIVQDDNTGTATEYGVRFPVGTGTILSVEPYFGYVAGGTTDETFGGLAYSRDGFDITQPGINVALGNLTGSGFRVYPFAGVSSHTLKRPGSDEITKIGYNGGLGLGLGPGNLLIDLRGTFNMIDVGEASRKSAAVTLGVGYRVTPGD